MFTELKEYIDNLIIWKISEQDFYNYIDNLIHSNIINDEYILDLIKNNVFRSSKYNSKFYHLLLYFNDKKLLKKIHYSQLIKQNYNVNKDIINLDEYNVIDFLNDINNDISGVYLFNYLSTIIKLLKDEDHKFLLYLNDNPDYLNRYPIIEKYIYNKTIHIEYLEWNNKYPKLWNKIIEYYINDYDFRSSFKHLNHFNIDKKILFDIFYNKLNDLMKYTNDYDLKTIINFLIEYSYSNKDLIKYTILLNIILNDTKYENNIFYIIHNKYYSAGQTLKSFSNTDDHKQKIINYLINNNNIYCNVLDEYSDSLYDFLFDNILDINIYINNYLDLYIDKYYMLKLNDNSVTMNIFNKLLLYLINYVFVNNIDYNFNKYDKLIRCDILNEFIIYNKNLNDNLDKFNFMINNYIENINEFEYICDVNMKNYINNIHKKDNNKLVYNIIYYDIKINNIDKLLEYMNNNNIDYNDKIYRMKLYRFINKYQNKINNKYNKLEKLNKNYKLNISYLMKTLKNKICDDLCKNIFDYL
jgi:hypothetical protein